MTAMATGVIERLDAVEERLRAQATAATRCDARTAPDPPTGEQWEAGQVWAHLAEFIPYWIGETTLVVATGTGAPVLFGRTKKDPGRIAAIERERRTDRVALWQRVEADIAALRLFVSDLPAAAWAARGRHATLGEMTVEEMVEEFLVGHLEEHATQLDGLADASAG